MAIDWPKRISWIAGGCSMREHVPGSRHSNLRTARARALEETATSLRRYTYSSAAQNNLERWHVRAILLHCGGLDLHPYETQSIDRLGRK